MTECFSHFARVLFSWNFAFAKFREIKTLAKISEFKPILPVAYQVILRAFLLFADFFSKFMLSKNSFRNSQVRPNGFGDLIWIQTVYVQFSKHLGADLDPFPMPKSMFFPIQQKIPIDKKNFLGVLHLYFI